MSRLGGTWSALFARSKEVVSEALSRFGIDVMDAEGTNALQYAMNEYSLEWVTLVVSHPLCACQNKIGKYTPLEWVLDYSYWRAHTRADIVNTMLDAKCDPDQRNERRETFMDIVARDHRDPSVVELLLKRFGVHSLFDSAVLQGHPPEDHPLIEQGILSPYKDPPVVVLTGPLVNPEVSAFVQAELAAFRTEFFRVTDAVLPVRDVATIAYQYIVSM